MTADTAAQAIADAAIAWSRGRISGLALLDTIARNQTAADVDPGRTLAWPEQEHEPVAGLDYLPAANDGDVDRNWIEPTTTGGGHGGYPIAGTLTEARAALAATRAAGVADVDEWIGWPNSVRRQVAA